MPTDGHSGFLKTGGSHIGAGRLFWYWGKAPGPVPSAGRVGAEKQQAGRTAVQTAPIVCPEESPLPVALGNNFAVRNSPLVGLDAPTPARIGTGRPMGRSHFSFGGERKVCKRKPAARRLREKALYCPFLKEGVRNVARSTVGLPTFTFLRARAHSFPLSKRARIFPSAAYRRSAPSQLACGRLTPCRVDDSLYLTVFSRKTKKASAYQQSAVDRLIPCRLGCFDVS